MHDDQVVFQLPLELDGVGLSGETDLAFVAFEIDSVHMIRT